MATVQMPIELAILSAMLSRSGIMLGRPFDKMLSNHWITWSYEGAADSTGGQGLTRFGSIRAKRYTRLMHMKKVVQFQTRGDPFSIQQRGIHVGTQPGFCHLNKFCLASDILHILCRSTMDTRLQVGV